MKVYDWCMKLFIGFLKKYTKLFLIKEKNIEKVLLHKKPTFVIFLTPTCYDCERLSLRLLYLLYLSKKNGYSLKFCDMDDSKDLAKKYDIDVKPTMIYFESGKEKGRYFHFKEIFHALKKNKK